MLRYLSAGAPVSTGAPVGGGAPAGARPALFVDRDGVLNERIVGGYVTSPNEVVVLDDALPALRLAASHGIPVVVVTNQGAIGRGVMSETDLMRVHAGLMDRLAERGVGVDAIYACPHHPAATAPDDRVCTCRKPGPGLFLAAARDLRLRLDRSAMIGDQPSDAAAARAAGLAIDNIWTVGESIDLERWAGQGDPIGVSSERHPGPRVVTEKGRM